VSGHYPEVTSPTGTTNGNYTLTLTPHGSVVGVNYFGLWVSALDAGSKLQIYNTAGTLLYTVTPATLIPAPGACPGTSAYCGNPSGIVSGQRGGQLRIPDRQPDGRFREYSSTDGNGIVLFAAGARLVHSAADWCGGHVRTQAPLGLPALSRGANATIESAMPSRPRRVFPALGFCAVLFTQAPSPAPPQTGTIEGDVADSLTHKPIAGARVKLQTRTGERLLSTRCDGNGRFQFQDVPFALLDVGADQPGYWNGGRPFRTVMPSPGSPLAQVHVSLQPYAIVSGRITDSAGVPAEGAFVELLKLPPIDPKQAGPPAPPPGGTATGDRPLVQVTQDRTNDLGEYRFALSAAGSYYVYASPAGFRDDSDETEHSTYYPRALRAASARPVAVAAGQEVSRIDIQLIRQAGVRVSGRVAKPADSPQGHSTWLVNTNVLAWWPNAPSVRGDVSPGDAGTGAFDLKNVPPGRYLVEALTIDNTDLGHPRTLLAGRRTIEVRDKNVDGVEIAMQAPVDIQGEVFFDENCPAVPVSIVPSVESRLAAIARQFTSATAGRFTLTGLVRARYTLAIGPQPPRTLAGYRYSVASARLGEREVLRNGFELTGQPPGALRIEVTCSVPPAAREVVR
jgi:hypothetical protein